MKHDEQRLYHLSQEKILQGSLRGVPSIKQQQQHHQQRDEDGTGTSRTSGARGGGAQQQQRQPFQMPMPGSVVALPDINSDTRRFARYRRPPPPPPLLGMPPQHALFPDAYAAAGPLVRQIARGVAAASGEGAAAANAGKATALYPGPKRIPAPFAYSDLQTLDGGQTDEGRGEPTVNPAPATPTPRPPSQRGGAFQQSPAVLKQQQQQYEENDSGAGGDVFTNTSDAHSASRSASRGSSRCGSSRASSRQRGGSRIEKLEQMLLEERQGRLDVIQKMQQLAAYVLKSQEPNPRTVPKPPMPR